jgi:putative addiction module CopG family antidote
MTVTLTPEMEEIIKQQLATGLFATQEEVVRAALLQLRTQHDELKAAINVGLDDIQHGRVAPLDVAATLARVRAKQAAKAGAE